ncbi:MAG: PP2C family serine/threonine-protein phosphatase [Actinomycetota bacterium]
MMTSSSTVDGSIRRGDWQWTACAASVTGEEHQRRGLGCDDAYSYGLEEGFIVAAVADGAGSVTGTSAWGAHIACRAIVDHAMLPDFIRDFRTGDFDGQVQMRWLFERALERVKAHAQVSRMDPVLLSTTLCVAVADRDRAVFGQIGDGVVAVESVAGDNRDIATLLIEDKDEYANSTWFLQSERAFEESFRTATLDGVDAFALSTDGMTYKITDVATGQAYEPFFRGSWDHVRSGVSAGHFAALLRGIEDDQTGDDKTMVLAALRFCDDEYFPSSRPVVRTLVTSPAPAAQAAPPLATSAAPPAAGNSGRLRRLLGGRGRS